MSPSARRIVIKSGRLLAALIAVGSSIGCSDSSKPAVEGPNGTVSPPTTDPTTEIPDLPEIKTAVVSECLIPDFRDLSEQEGKLLFEADNGIRDLLTRLRPEQLSAYVICDDPSNEEHSFSLFVFAADQSSAQAIDELLSASLPVTYGFQVKLVVNGFQGHSVAARQGLANQLSRIFQASSSALDPFQVRQLREVCAVMASVNRDALFIVVHDGTPLTIVDQERIQRLFGLVSDSYVGQRPAELLKVLPISSLETEQALGLFDYGVARRRCENGSEERQIGLSELQPAIAVP